MAIVTQASPLPYGATLVFHYDDAFPQDEQVGTLSYYQNFINDLHQNSLGYYDQPDGTNKFLRRVTLHIWADQVPYDTSPDNNPYEGTFWTFCDANNCAHIYAHWIDYNNTSTTPSDAYRFPASLSHEFGHAYQFWCGWPENSTWGQVVSDFWDKEVIGSSVYPSGWNRMEAWANAFRYFKGCTATRGISGTLNGGSDPCPAPMNDPAVNPQWLKQFNLMGELNAYMATYGCEPTTLTWLNGTWGYWQFKNAGGTWVAQTDYDVWYRWVDLGGNWQWQQFWPGYTRI